MVDKPYAIKRAHRNMLTLMSGNQHTLNANQVKKNNKYSNFFQFWNGPRRDVYCGLLFNATSPIKCINY